ncbi:hypothetical protein [Acinetobacter gerneri]|jgi:hypothetical protein|uniref:hypothetical protein n=1 Tax=Acinetobacter gerneri TaxID=202952 RepID=UPI0023EF68EA|nr:hypothetical protein [Acinetobacter gerneri]MCH4242935.1 hypothetical protein [Acinetobacter gerneri]
MNVEMIEHQRNIMAAMGIDIWVPQGCADIRQVNTSLYRDMARAEAEIEAVLPHIQNETAPQKTIQSDIAITTALQTKVTQPVHENKKPFVDQNAVGLDVNTQNKNTVTHSNIATELLAPLAVDAFYLQAVSLENCVIVVDVSKLSEAENTLWGNIQRAAPHQYDELKWPFPLGQFQDGRSAHIYVQGFVDALRSDKHVLSLGALPHLADLKLIQLASLQEMLDQPLLKRRLWQFMRNKIEQMEVK